MVRGDSERDGRREAKRWWEGRERDGGRGGREVPDGEGELARVGTAVPKEVATVLCR